MAAQFSLRRSQPFESSFTSEGGRRINVACAAVQNTFATLSAISGRSPPAAEAAKLEFSSYEWRKIGEQVTITIDSPPPQGRHNSAYAEEVTTIELLKLGFRLSNLIRRSEILDPDSRGDRSPDRAEAESWNSPTGLGSPNTGWS